MADVELDQDVARRAKEERLLPLVVEIMAGQAREGLVDIYEPGTYEGKSLRQLCEQTLAREDLSIEERQIVEEIRRQLKGGKLLSRGKEIDDRALNYVERQQTEIGENYLYVPIRAIKPQEGGDW
ncbi:MAG: hypothetical protein JRJ12_02200 [Deltaproteobacteria bacterium]|nr:hypothetical protein [Deltaproteobacteria bacterium]MBW2070084.1 hypothetical protein [Deltaproteobacteria bacterium]